MKLQKSLTTIVLASVLVPAFVLFTAGHSNADNTQIKPDIRLVLQITVDGLRADLLDRYADGFGEGASTTCWGMAPSILMPIFSMPIPKPLSATRRWQRAHFPRIMA